MVFLKDVKIDRTGKTSKPMLCVCSAHKIKHKGKKSLFSLAVSSVQVSENISMTCNDSNAEVGSSLSNSIKLICSENGTFIPGSDNQGDPLDTDDTYFSFLYI